MNAICLACGKSLYWRGSRGSHMPKRHCDIVIESGMPRWSRALIERQGVSDCTGRLSNKNPLAGTPAALTYNPKTGW